MWTPCVFHERDQQGFRQGCQYCLYSTIGKMKNEIERAHSRVNLLEASFLEHIDNPESHETVK